MSQTHAPDDELAFDTPNLAEAVESLSRDRLDALPFGAIRLDATGTVQLYNRTESRRSGMDGRPVEGFDFFADVAPCMDTPGFRGRIERARASGTLDLAFRHAGDFEDRAREIAVRIQSAPDGGLWIFHDRPGGDPVIH